MKFRFFAAIVVALAMTTIAARAQLGIYVNPIGTHVTNSVADTGPFAFLGQDSKSQWFYGVSIGSYMNLYHQGKVNAGLDVRDTIQHGNNASLNQFLVGGRVAVSPFKIPIKPYAQLSVGAGTTRAPTNNVHITRFVPSVAVGADYTLSRHFDWRIFEVSYGSLATVSTSSVGSGPNIPNSHLLGFSTGFVIKVP
jgi:hypothetical protein